MLALSVQSGCLAVLVLASFSEGCSLPVVMSRTAAGDMRWLSEHIKAVATTVLDTTADNNRPH